MCTYVSAFVRVRVRVCRFVRVMQCDAVCCSVLQCVAVFGSEVE